MHVDTGPAHSAARSPSEFELEIRIEATHRRTGSNDNSSPDSTHVLEATKTYVEFMALWLCYLICKSATDADIND